MPTVNQDHPAAVTIAMDLSSLGSSPTLIAGYESEEINNTTDKYIDVKINGEVTTGTSPTDAKNIYVYVYGSGKSLATDPIDVLDGTESAETFNSEELRDSGLKLGAIINTDNTSNTTYKIPEFSVAELFGSSMPEFWGLFVTHDTGVNLNASNNDLFYYKGVTYTST